MSSKEHFLNIGGCVFPFRETYELLVHYPDSYLKHCMDTTTNDEELYMNRDGKLFQYIQIFLRTNNLPPLNYDLLLLLRIESEFYHLYELTDRIANQIYVLIVNINGFKVNIYRSSTIFSIFKGLFDCKLGFHTDAEGLPFIDLPPNETIAILHYLHYDDMNLFYSLPIDPTILTKTIQKLTKSCESDWKHWWMQRQKNIEELWQEN